MKMLKKTLFILGVILLSVNIFGLFKSMRNPEIYTLEQKLKNRLNDVVIKYPDIKKQLVRRENESEVDFAVRVNKVVNDGFAHYWKSEGIEIYNMRVPIWENYLLYAASYINPKKYQRYEFSNYKKGLERGVGLCSSHSIVVKGVLLDNGIKAELLDVGGRHVVVRAEFNNSTAYMLDPDFGYYVPHDTAAITANPELVREPYSTMASLYYKEAVEPYTTDMMVDIFGKRKYVYNVSNPFEDFSYWAIWIIPVLLMLPLIISSIKRNRHMVR
ncbi:MAG: hypothetical protein EOO10_12785 [Chitinophagaceae bacterium]|nr:MAG: hypothetical protein EOO10_12785 [Chitinophagaceae bacterium]